MRLWLPCQNIFKSTLWFGIVELTHYFCKFYYAKQYSQYTNHNRSYTSTNNNDNHIFSMVFGGSCSSSMESCLDDISLRSSSLLSLMMSLIILFTSSALSAFSNATLVSVSVTSLPDIIRFLYWYWVSSSVRIL